MSKSKSESRSIVKRILALLNLTEEGKIGHFFDKVSKSINRNIESLNYNKKAEELTHKQALDAINEQIEDAQEAVEAAYTDVSIDRIQTNRDQDSFMDEYFRNIDRAQAELKALQARKEDLIDSYKATISDINEQIKAYQVRLDRIS